VTVLRLSVVIEYSKHSSSLQCIQSGFCRYYERSRRSLCCGVVCVVGRRAKDRDEDVFGHAYPRLTCLPLSSSHQSRYKYAEFEVDKSSPLSTEWQIQLMKLQRHATPTTAFDREGICWLSSYLGRIAEDVYVCGGLGKRDNGMDPTQNNKCSAYLTGESHHCFGETVHILNFDLCWPTPSLICEALPHITAQVVGKPCSNLEEIPLGELSYLLANQIQTLRKPMAYGDVSSIWMAYQGNRTRKDTSPHCRLVLTCLRKNSLV